MIGEASALIWVCQCCMLCHANGECCADDGHGGDGKEPLSLIGQYEHVTLGGAPHDENYCTEADRESGECRCDDYGFSTMSCSGCGSSLAGDRYALTVWWTPDEPEDPRLDS